MDTSSTDTVTGTVPTSPEFLQLLRGVDIPCMFEYPVSPPPWLDTTLYDIGIKYYHKNTLGIMASNGEALIMGLASPIKSEMGPPSRAQFVSCVGSDDTSTPYMSHACPLSLTPKQKEP